MDVEKLFTTRNVLVGTVTVIVIVIVIGLIWNPVNGNEYSHHSPNNQAIHERFYNTWMMPDNRTMSCCHSKDCSPAETYWLNGHWMARKVEESDKNFVPIPDAKVEQDRDNPDGRSHLCGNRSFPSGNFTVYCFIAG